MLALSYMPFSDTQSWILEVVSFKTEENAFIDPHAQVP